MLATFYHCIHMSIVDLFYSIKSTTMAVFFALMLIWGLSATVKSKKGIQK